MEHKYIEEERYLRAQKRVKDLQGFYWHLFWYVIVNLFILGMILFNIENKNDFFQFAHFSTAFFWGIGIFFHWLGVFGIKGSFFKNWEKRKIKEFIEKDNEL